MQEMPELETDTGRDTPSSSDLRNRRITVLPVVTEAIFTLGDDEFLFKRIT